MLTHLHADHWFGLPGMLKSFDLRDREKPLEIFGPPGTRAILKQVEPVYGRLGYRLDIEELDADESLRFDGYRVQTFATRHRGPSIGYVFLEDDRPGRFDAGRAVELGIEPGPEFGQLQRGETVRGVEPSQVMGETRRGRRVVFTGDTRPSDSTVVAATGADLLIHEGTFVTEDKARAAETAHSTGAQAAQVAADAGVKLLALTHVAARVHVSQLEQEAREVFDNTIVVRDFDEIELPLPDRGDPVHHRWSDRRREQHEAAQAAAAGAPQATAERENAPEQADPEPAAERTPATR
ncbi:MAG: MBL fold metallo-hydrolase [Patulibacter sp.]|nr:MBL fold metallo-hydrolase [Patulibacter sp.]